MLEAAPPAAAARTVCVRKPQLRATRAAGACAAPQQQLRARRLAGFRRSAFLLARGKASALQPVRAGSLPDDVLENMQRPLDFQKREYLPHEVVRAVLQLPEDPTRTREACVHVSSFPMASLLTNHPKLLPYALFDSSRYSNTYYKIIVPATQGHDASCTDRPWAKPPDEVAAARRRLLRLMDALEAAAPAILCGSKIAKPSLRRLTEERLRALAAFATLVPDEAWAQPPETWTPHASDMCARSRRLAPLSLLLLHWHWPRC
jgi:hypothetical protein